MLPGANPLSAEDSQYRKVAIPASGFDFVQKIAGFDAAKHAPNR